MLQIRPNCEYCDKDLPANAPDAMICSYECTFCVSCVDNHLRNVCPNCGGGFERRPIRPQSAHRTGTGLVNSPASTQRHALKHERDQLPAFIQTLSDIPPDER